jgi:hypothetical protein
MAKHVDPGTIGGAASDSATSLSMADHGRDASVQAGSQAQGGIIAHESPALLGPYPAYHGRTVSWVAVAIVVAGFLVGGLALIFGSHGPTWWLFWVGTALTVIGFLAMIATNTFNDWY